MQPETNDPKPPPLTLAETRALWELAASTGSRALRLVWGHAEAARQFAESPAAEDDDLDSLPF